MFGGVQGVEQKPTAMLHPPKKRTFMPTLARASASKYLPGETLLCHYDWYGCISSWNVCCSFTQGVQMSREIMLALSQPLLNPLNPDCHCMPPSVSIIRRLPPKLFFGAKKVSLSTFFSWTFLAASITSSINQIPWNTNSGVGGFCLGVQSPEPFLDQLRTPSWPRDAGKASHSL